MELGWMGGWMGGFCQGFKAMTSLKCDWSDAVTVGEPSRMMSVLSIFSLQSVEQTVEEWGGGAKLTGNSFTQQQVCVLQSCTKRKKQRASSSSSYFSHLCSQQQMLCVGVSVCVRMCVWLCLCVCRCMCVSVWLWVLVCVFCDIFFFFLALVQTTRTAPSSVSTQSLLCCPYLLSSCIIPSLFSLLISFPSCSSLSPWFLFLYFLYYFFYFSFFPPFSSCYFVYLLTSSSSLSHPHPLFDFVTISSLLPSFPFTSPLLSILSYFPSFLPPSSVPSTSATAADWDWSGALHCGKLEVGGCGKLSR